MKHLFPVTCLTGLFFLFSLQFSAAQSVAINTDGSIADGTAILDLKSSSKGLLVPRMTTLQRTAITAPATGLLVFDTDTNLFWYYDGSVWKKLDPAGSYWSTTGNSGTVAGTNFIGTTDAIDAVLKTNNTEKMRWLYTANGKNVVAAISNGDLTVNTITVGRGPGNVNGNTALGYQTLNTNTNSGLLNTALGFQVLASNTSGSNNTATGYQAMAFNTLGNNNTAAGYMSLCWNTTGARNTAMGRTALYNTTVGTGNTALGSYAMYYNTNGNYNTATGDDALGNNVSGNSNAALGQQSIYQNTSGSFNAAVGVSALFSTTGSYNTGMGSEAMGFNGSGSNNTGVGYNADVSAANLTNATAIGSGALVNASNKVVIGNTSVTIIGGQVGWSTLSDGRFKTNIREDVPGLDFIMQLRPVNYNFLARKYQDHLLQRMPDSVKNKPGRKAVMNSEAEKVLHTGFIAQEVEQVVNRNGYHFEGVHKPTSESDNYSITYDEFVVPLVKAMQQLNTKVEQLSKENEALKKQLLDMNQRLLKMEAR